MGSASALKPSSHALHCGSREQSLPHSVGSGLAFWKVALASDPGSPEGGGQPCIMFLPNATHISPEDIPSLAFRRSSQDALQGRKVAFPVPSPSLTSVPLCLTSLTIPGFQGGGHTGAPTTRALVLDTGEHCVGSLSSQPRLSPHPVPPPSPLSPCNKSPCPLTILRIGVAAVAQTMGLY